MADEHDESEDEEVEEGAPAWMATFADMATLLLTFFVLLLSFANMDVKNFREALGSVREAFGVQFRHPGDLMGLTTSVVELSKEESVPNSRPIELKLVQRITALLEASGFATSLEVSSEDDGIALRITDRLLFRDGEAELLPAAERVLRVVAEVAREVKLPLWIEGHTDNRPIRTSRFPSNWELSAARALAALHHLVRREGLNAAQLRVGGLADGRPLASNDSEAGRARNRRVEFVFLRPREGDAEAWRELSARLDAAHARSQAARATGGATDPVAEVPSEFVHDAEPALVSQPRASGLPEPSPGPALSPSPVLARPTPHLQERADLADSSPSRVEALMPPLLHEAAREASTTPAARPEVRSRRPHRRR